MMTTALLAMLVVTESVEVTRPDAAALRGTQRTIVDGAKLRRDTSNSTQVLFLDGDAGTMCVGDKSVKARYCVESEAIAKSDAVGPMMYGWVRIDGENVLPANIFVPTGKTAQIQSWRAREVKTLPRDDDGPRVTLWIADEDVPSGVYEAILEKIFSRAGSHWRAWFVQRKKLGGFPVRTIMEWRVAGGIHRVTATVVGIDRPKKAPDDIAPPATWVETPPPFADGHR